MPAADQPVPYALTPKALAALATAPGARFCPESLAADRPTYCDPADCCRAAFGPAPAAGPTGAGWACLGCGDAWFGTPPDDGLCPDCGRTDGAR